MIAIVLWPVTAGSFEWGAKEKSVVKVPQWSGFSSGALGPPQTSRSISSTGTWGRSLKTAVSLPVLGSGCSSPGIFMWRPRASEVSQRPSWWPGLGARW